MTVLSEGLLSCTTVSTTAPPPTNTLAAVPSLITLSRHALIHGLSNGIKLSSIPEHLYLSEEFWDDLLHEASRRKLLCDAFLNALVGSGIPLRKLVLKHSDVGISSNWLLGLNNKQKFPPEEDGNGSIDCMLEQLTQFTFLQSGNKNLNDSLPCGSSSTNNHNIAKSNHHNIVHHQGHEDELITFLHRLARNAPLAKLHLNFQDDGQYPSTQYNAQTRRQLSGSLKAISTQSNSRLMEVSLHGIFHAEVFDNFVECMACACRNLRKLSLRNCTGFRDAHGQVLFTTYSTVKAFDGGASSFASHVDTSEVEPSNEVGCAVGLMNLTELDLSYTAVGGLTFAALYSRAFERRRLITHNNTVENTVLKKTKANSLKDQEDGSILPSINSLNLNGTSIDLSWLAKLLEAMGDDLTELSILHCPCLSDGTEIWNMLTTTKTTPPPSSVESSSLSFGLTNLKHLSMELWFTSAQLLPSIHTTATNRRDSPYDPLATNDWSENEEFSAESLFANKIHEVNAPPNDSVLQHDQGWICKHCTLINVNASMRCAACNNKKRIRNKAETRPNWENLGSMPSLEEEEIIEEAFHFVPLPCTQLKILTVVVHVDEEQDKETLEESLQVTQYDTVVDDSAYCNDSNIDNTPQQNGNAITSAWVENHATNINEEASSEVAISAFVHELINCIPENSLSDLTISSILKKCHYGRKAFTLGTVEVSRIIKKVGNTLTKLNLSGVLFTNINSFGQFWNGMKQVRELKLIGDTLLKPCIPEILQVISQANSSINLEQLHLCIRGEHDVTDLESGIPERITAHGSNNEQSCVILSALSLTELWIQGCPVLQKLIFDTPVLESMHVSNCLSLSHISYHEPLQQQPKVLQNLQLRQNPSLDPYSIATLKPSNLKRIHLDGIHALQDWQFKNLVFSSRFSLTCMRLQCRNLGNVSSWMAGCGPFQPLNVLHLFKPAVSFDVINLQSLFLNSEYNNGSGDAALVQDDNERGKALRDLIVHSAAGLKGILCAPQSSIASCGKAFAGVGAAHNDKAPYCLPRSVAAAASLSMLGSGAVDDTDEEMIGTRHITQTLSEFVESAIRGEGGGGYPMLSARYQFPPTLNSYQRKLVHEVADSMELEHESISLGRGVKAVEIIMTTEAMKIYRDENLLHATACTSDRELTHIDQDNRQRNVMFHLNGEYSDVEDDDEGGGNANNGNGLGGGDTGDGVFDLEVEEKQDVEPVAVEVPLSRRAARQANKRKKKVPTATIEREELNGTNNSTSNHQDFALDPILQCEISGHIDGKLHRRLIASARQLPTEKGTGKAACVKFLRGVCPYQHSTNAGKCSYAHFIVKPNKVKKFAQLMDFVCGRESNAAAGGRQGGTSRMRKKQLEPYALSSSYGSSDGNHGQGDGADLMESNMGRRYGTRKNSRRSRSGSGSIGSETDGADEELSSHTAHSVSGTSPGESPKSFRHILAFADLLHNSAPSRLNLNSLIRLELVDCNGLTGISVSGRALVTLRLNDCINLACVDVMAQHLQSLDVSGCLSLKKIPLHQESLRKLRFAILTHCRALNEEFMVRIVDHCRVLCQLHIFGSGASERASNAKSRQKVKTKSGLQKLTTGRPKLELFTTKKEWRESKAKGGCIARFEDGDNSATNNRFSSQPL